MTRAGETVGRVREGERVFDLVLRLGGEQIDERRGPRAPADRDQERQARPAGPRRRREPRSGRSCRSGASRCAGGSSCRRNVRGRDMVGFVREAQARVSTLTLPEERRARVGRSVPELQPREGPPRRRSCPWRSRVIARHARHDVPQRCATRSWPSSTCPSRSRAAPPRWSCAGCPSASPRASASSRSAGCR